ncbi:hypothetical protein [Haloparvum sedimenti]|uniref:hypothetical protein n=1 Tax=Haloparvum sedimenti TaxID=1678448 RepID=UPI000F7B1256|nr:hypothetical protein [Haloparvum sedimenti]
MGGTERGSRLDPAPAPQALAPGVAERCERAERAADGRAGWGFLGVAVPISRIDNRHRKRIVGRAGWGFLGVAVPISRIDNRHRKRIVGRAGWGFPGGAVQSNRICHGHDTHAIGPNSSRPSQKPESVRGAFSSDRGIATFETSTEMGENTPFVTL